MHKSTHFRASLIWAVAMVGTAVLVFGSSQPCSSSSTCWFTWYDIAQSLTESPEIKTIGNLAPYLVWAGFFLATRWALIMIVPCWRRIAYATLRNWKQTIVDGAIYGLLMVTAFPRLLGHATLAGSDRALDDLILAAVYSLPLAYLWARSRERCRNQKLIRTLHLSQASGKDH